MEAPEAVVAAIFEGGLAVFVEALLILRCNVAIQVLQAFKS
jgi:hypothetical protein